VGPDTERRWTYLDADTDMEMRNDVKDYKNYWFQTRF
jgi:hypothetical protein